MGFTIANHNRAICIDKDAMQPVHGTTEWITVGAITFLTGSCHQFEASSLMVDHPNAVAFRIRQPNIAR